MLHEWIKTLQEQFGKAFFETFQMVGISMSAAVLIGGPLGLFLFITLRGLFFENKFLNVVSGLIVNVIRSIPFVILLVVLLPFTKLVAGSTIGSVAASVPLSVAAIAFYARLVESALREVDKGTIEAATALGASPAWIVRFVLLPAAFVGNYLLVLRTRAGTRPPFPSPCSWPTSYTS